MQSFYYIVEGCCIVPLHSPVLPTRRKFGEHLGGLGEKVAGGNRVVHLTGNSIVDLARRLVEDFAGWLLQYVGAAGHLGENDAGRFRGSLDDGRFRHDWGGRVAAGLLESTDVSAISGEVRFVLVVGFKVVVWSNIVSVLASGDLDRLSRGNLCIQC